MKAVTDVDQHSAAYRENWQQIADDHLADASVAWTDAHGGGWVVFGYQYAVQVLTDWATFSSYQDHTDPTSPLRGTTTPPQPHLSVPQELDPPASTVYRRLLNGPFSPERSRQRESFIRRVVTACLDRVCETGTADLVDDLTNPVPAIVTMDVLGLPLAEWERYAAAIHRIVYSPPASPEAAQAAVAVGEMMTEVGKTVVSRRADPADDLISTLAAATDADGQLLPLDHVISTCGLVIAGGVDTTTALVSQALHWLHRHPAERDRLIADPALIPSAVEEFLRAFGAVQFMSRTATRDVVLGGQQIKSGDRVLVSFGAANRDPQVFDEPGQVRIDRSPNRHIAFGYGVHRCVGAHLAKVQAVVMLQEALRRVPDFVIDEERVQRYPSIGVVNGYVNLPATFTPSPAVGASFPR
jgi:cytochrome P450